MMRRTLGVMLLLAACSDDDRGTVQQDMDAGPTSDAGLDARSSDALTGGCQALDQTYKFYRDGGKPPSTDVYTLSPDGSIAIAGLRRDDAGAPYSCSASLGTCGSSTVNLQDFRSAFAAASSFWNDGSTVYGENPRPYDGQVLVIERADGKKISIGYACPESAVGCARPEPVVALNNLYNRLYTGLFKDRLTGGLGGICTP